MTVAEVRANSQAKAAFAAVKARELFGAVPAAPSAGCGEAEDSGGEGALELSCGLRSQAAITTYQYRRGCLGGAEPPQTLSIVMQSFRYSTDVNVKVIGNVLLMHIGVRCCKLPDLFSHFGSQLRASHSRAARRWSPIETFCDF